MTHQPQQENGKPRPPRHCQKYIQSDPTAQCDCFECVEAEKSIKELRNSTPEKIEGDWEKEFIEKGADIEHDRWARWQKYLHSKCTTNGESKEIVIPAFLVERWERQINTPYSELSEAEKESDRKESRNYLPLIKEIISSERQRLLEEVIGEIENKFNSIDKLDHYCKCEGGIHFVSITRENYDGFRQWMKDTNSLRISKEK